MKDFLIGEPSHKFSAYTLLHDKYYGIFLPPDERIDSLSSSKVYRQKGLLSLPSPRTGVVDANHFKDCILEEFIRNPLYFSNLFDTLEHQDLWRYFRPLWDWYFPHRAEVFLEAPFLSKSFPRYCKNLWEIKANTCTLSLD